MNRIFLLSFLIMVLASCQDGPKMQLESNLQDKKQFFEKIELRGKNVLALGRKKGLESEILLFQQHQNDTSIDFSSYVKEWDVLNKKIMYGWEPEMVLVEGGAFEMGNNNAQDVEKPMHIVALQSFYICKHEVTVAQYQAVIGVDLNDYDNRYDVCPDCAFEGLTHFEALAFISSLSAQTGKNYRLPTEAEWEYAAKGGRLSKGYIYSGSNEINDVAWSNSKRSAGKHNGTSEVCFKQSNELGIFDMSGNVQEWCSDRYQAYDEDFKYDFQSQVSFGSNNYVFRGGRWGDDSEACRVTKRNGCHPDEGFGGIRLVLSAPILEDSSQPQNDKKYKGWNHK